MGGEGPKFGVFLHVIYCTLINTSEQLMSQRHRIFHRVWLPAVRYKRIERVATMEYVV